MPPKKTRKAAPKASARKSSTPRKPAARRKPTRRGPSATSAATKPTSWRRWLALEAATWSAGVALGVAATSGLLWARATADVEAYLADPPRVVPSVVWSAPMQVRPGMHVSVPSLAGDLLAAGYERVDRVSPSDGEHGAGLFSVSGGTLEVWTEAWSGPDGEVPRGRATLRIEDGVVAGTSSPGGVTLRPTVLGTIGDLASRREDVTLSRLSPHVEPALLSMEDTRFREHHGIDPVGLLRAVAHNVIGGRRQGGSTLTQQLAKNLFLSQERTLRRKVREAFFAAALEHELSKDELLELYLGEVYLGQMGGLPLHGVEQASRAWFGVSAERLQLHEAATLVGVIPAPNLYSPVRHPEACKERRDLVLRRMRELGAIDEASLAAALSRPLELAGLEPSRVRRAPYAVDVAVDRAEAVLGQGALAARGYGVHTTLQPVLQRAAEDAVAAGMAELDAEYPKAAGAQVALVAIRTSDGAVVAMVGGRSYASSPYNRAWDARRQAGSTVKPLTLLEALDLGKVTPATRLDDEPMSRHFDGTTWTPHNYDGQFLGQVTVRQALEGSRNIPAVHLAEEVGATRLQRFFHDVGLTDATNLPSAALGAFPVSPVELAGAYTAFDQGTAWTPRVLDAIVTADGEVVLDLEPEGSPVASEQSAAQALRVLQGVLTSGTGARAARYGVGLPAGGKTGTTDDYRDAWFVGLTPELAVAVWVGRDRGTLGLSGSRAALPTWARFVAASGTLTTPARRPEGLIEVELCAESGLGARDACEERVTDLFVPGTEPDEACDVHGSPPVQAVRLLGNLFRRHRDEEPD